MTRITRSDELRYANRARVLACLRANGRQSRKQIATFTRLSAATITQVTAQLLDQQIIVESNQPQLPDGENQSVNAFTSHLDKRASKAALASDKIASADCSADRATGDNTSSRRGRPQVVLELTPQAAMVATVTVNFDRIEVTLFDYCGTELAQHSNAIQMTGQTGRTLLQQITATLQHALNPRHIDATQLLHITVACQGKVSKHDGNLLWSPRSQSETIAVGSHFRAHFGVNVSVDNDCNMIASALYHAKLPAAGSDANASGEMGSNGNFAVVLISYGIGLGLIHEGAILTGSRSSGTELGHMQISVDGPLCRCGNHGCIEAYAADYAIWRRVNDLRRDEIAEKTIPPEVMQQIYATAVATDGIERTALREAGAAIGQGLANLFAIFDSFPTRLVGLNETTACIVAKAIHERLLHSGDTDTENLVSVHSGENEIELVRRGAAMQGLKFVDQQVFSTGSPANVYRN